MSSLRGCRRTSSIIGSAFFALIGVVMVIAAILLSVNEQQFISKATKVSGTVSSLVTSVDSKNNTNYRPVVDFTTVDGKSYSYTSNISSSPSQYQVGDKVDVYYDPTDPSQVVIGGATGTVFLLVGGLGVAFALIGTLTVIFRVITGR